MMDHARDCDNITTVSIVVDTSSALLSKSRRATYSYCWRVIIVDCAARRYTYRNCPVGFARSTLTHSCLSSPVFSTWLISVWRVIVLGFLHLLICPISIRFSYHVSSVASYTLSTKSVNLTSKRNEGHYTSASLPQYTIWASYSLFFV